MVWRLLLSLLFSLFLQISVSSCDLLVVSVGQMSMGRAINIVQKLWTAGIPAEIMYDWSQVEFLSMCAYCSTLRLTQTDTIFFYYFFLNHRLIKLRMQSATKIQ